MLDKKQVVIGGHYTGVYHSSQYISMYIFLSLIYRKTLQKIANSYLAQSFRTIQTFISLTERTQHFSKLSINYETFASFFGLCVASFFFVCVCE